MPGHQKASWSISRWLNARPPEGFVINLSMAQCPVTRKLRNLSGDGTMPDHQKVSWPICRWHTARSQESFVTYPEMAQFPVSRKLHDLSVDGTMAGHQKASWSSVDGMTPKAARSLDTSTNFPIFYFYLVSSHFLSFKLFSSSVFSYLYIYFFDSQYGIKCRNHWAAIGLSLNYRMVDLTNGRLLSHKFKYS